MSIYHYAVILSIIEAIAQGLLKSSYQKSGMVCYTIVAAVLASSYRSGMDLSAMQFMWSITSSTLAIAQGWLVFGEQIYRLLLPLVLLCAAHVTMNI